MSNVCVSNLVASLVKDVQLEPMGGSSKVEFSVPVEEYVYVQAAGRKQNVTVWYNCLVTGKQAESFASLCTKGTVVSMPVTRVTETSSEGRKFEKYLVDSFTVVSGYRSKDSSQNSADPSIPEFGEVQA